MVHVCTHSQFGKQGRVHSAILSHQRRRLQERFFFFDSMTKPGAPTGIDVKRHRHGHNLRMSETDGGDSSLGTDEVDGEHVCAHLRGR